MGESVAALFVIGELAPASGRRGEHDGLDAWGSVRPLKREGKGGVESFGICDLMRRVGDRANGVADQFAGLADADDRGGAGGEEIYEWRKVDVFVVAADEEDGGARGEGVECGDGGVGAGGFGVVVEAEGAAVGKADGVDEREAVGEAGELLDGGEGGLAIERAIEGVDDGHGGGGVGLVVLAGDEEGDGGCSAGGEFDDATVGFGGPGGDDVVFVVEDGDVVGGLEFEDVLFAAE